MALVAVARQAGVVAEQGLSVTLGDAGDETHAGLVEHVVASVEHRRPLRRGLEQVAQRRHRAVVQVGGAQPDAVERHVGVAEGLPEVLEAMRIAGVERGLVHRQVVGVGVEPRAVGGDLGNRCHMADPLAGKVLAAGASGRRRSIRRRAPCRVPRGLHPRPMARPAAPR